MSRWANWAGGLPYAQQAIQLDLLFSPTTGLGLNIVRYNIGGGAVSVQQQDRFRLANSVSLNAFKISPGFKAGPAMPYNWSQDANQRRIMLGAKARGVDRFEAVSYSPPAWLTISGSTTGNKNGMNNLDPANYEAFAEYLTDVVAEYARNPAWNITFDYLDPVNEPENGAWMVGGTQEGCDFSNPALDSFLPIVARALAAKKLSTKIAAIDGWIFNTPQTLQALSTSTQNVIKRLNVHGYAHNGQLGYDNEVATRVALAKYAAKQGVSVAMSEWGPLNYEGLTELGTALLLALKVILDMNVMQVVSWSYWLAIGGSAKPPHWGLITTPYVYGKNVVLTKNKQYYTMMHFSRWIRPGSLIMRMDTKSCQGGLVVSYNAKQNQLVLVLAHYGVTERTIIFDMTAVHSMQVSGIVYAYIYHTTDKLDHAYGGYKVVHLPGNFTVTLGKNQFISTYIFKQVRVLGNISTRSH